MRKIVLASLLAAGFAVAATAQQPQVQSGQIFNVDRAGKGFSARSYTGTKEFKTTPRTMILAGSRPTSFAYVKSGEFVDVRYHQQGKDAIADQVVVR